jgi:hypothetical protein
LLAELDMRCDIMYDVYNLLLLPFRRGLRTLGRTRNMSRRKIDRRSSCLDTLLDILPVTGNDPNGIPGDHCPPLPPRSPHGMCDQEALFLLLDLLLCGEGKEGCG